MKIVSVTESKFSSRSKTKINFQLVFLRAILLRWRVFYLRVAGRGLIDGRVAVDVALEQRPHEETPSETML